MPETKSLTVSDKLWRELTPEHVTHFAKVGRERAVALDDLAYKTSCELTKYLFTANTGAAAGVFLLLNSAARQSWHLAAFFIFCGGAFFVGVAYLAMASWSRELSEGWSADLNAWGRNEITISTVDARNRQRQGSRKKMIVRWGLTVSFALLILGGLAAAVPFCTGSPAKTVPVAPAK